MQQQHIPPTYRPNRFMDEQTWNRFWSKVAVSDPDACWIWTGGLRRRDAAYGGFYWRGRTHIASRVAFQIVHETPLGDLLVCHKCDNPPCCNPAHLFLGTPLDNAHDMIRKGREPDHPLGDLAHAVKLTFEECEEIRRRYAAGGISQRALAADFGVTASTVCVITKGKSRAWA